MGSRLVAHLDERSAGGASAATLAGQIRALILDGRVTVGERLPSERALAAELHRSRSTITRAYDALESDGYVVRVHGGGTRVALPHQGLSPAAAPDDEAIDMSVASMPSTPGLYDATVRALPRLAAERATTGYSLQGLPELRAAVARRFAERGAPTSPDEVLITGGAMHALNLVLSSIARRGGQALIEQPTFPHAIEALRRHGYRTLPSPVDAGGWDAGHLADSLLRARPHLAYLIPDFHNPTGATMPDPERAVVAATARSAGTRLIVDETTAELDVDRGWSPAPFAALGPHVITIGSLSKLAWGGLRLGWIRAEGPVIARILAARASFDFGTAFLEQCIAVELLDDLPSLATHVRERLTAGRDAVAAGVDALGGPSMPRVPGGLSAWIDLGAPISTQLSLAAREHGLILPPGPRFAAGGVLERRLRVPITHDQGTTAEAMRRLALAWRDVGRGGPPLRGEPQTTAVV